MAKSSQSGGIVGIFAAVAMIAAAGAIVYAFVLTPNNQVQTAEAQTDRGTGSGDNTGTANLGSSSEDPTEAEGAEGNDDAAQADIETLKGQVSKLETYTGINEDAADRTPDKVEALKPVNEELNQIKGAISSSANQNLTAMILAGVAFLGAVAATLLAWQARARLGALEETDDQLKGAISKEQKSVKKLKAEVESLAGQVGRLENEITTIEAMAKKAGRTEQVQGAARSSRADLGAGGVPPIDNSRWEKSQSAPPAPPPRSTQPSIGFGQVQRIVTGGGDMSSSEFRENLDALGRRLDVQVSGGGLFVSAAGGGGGAKSPVAAVVDPASGQGYLLPSVDYLRNFGASYQKIQNDVNETIKPFFELEVTETGELAYQKPAIIRVDGHSVELVERGTLVGYIY